MKVITHKYRLKEDQTCFLVNLVDHTGRPLESHVALKHISWRRIKEVWIVPTVFHNSGFSLVE